MNSTISRAVITKTIPWGWSFVFYLLTVIAALALAAPYAHAVSVSASVPATSTPGATLTATGTYTLGPGETFVSSNWSQVEGVTANIATPVKNTDTGTHSTDVTLGSDGDYAAYLVKVLKTPPITAADLPPDLKLQPINEINKGLQDATQVVAITPAASEKAETVILRFSVTTNPGAVETTTDVTVTTELPWVINPGVRTVPISDAISDDNDNHPPPNPALMALVSGHAVLLIAKCGEIPVVTGTPPEPTGEYVCHDQTTFDWQLNTKPGGSSASLTDANTRTPWFVPDKSGTYTLTETVSGDTLEVHAGLYKGVISPTATLANLADPNGDHRPETDPLGVPGSCLNCHRPGGAAPDNFTTWRQTGHAEAFYLNLTNPLSNHFGVNCFSCHTVGFDRGAAGFNDHDDYELTTPNFVDNVLPGFGTAQKWTDMLTDYPDLARVSNIQCENCHGPQNSNSHPYDSAGSVDSRVSLKSEVCGSCHGEPLRHGRFQQWQLSSHADYDLARERGTGTNGANCGRCHSGNGFVQWSKAAEISNGAYTNFDPNYLLDVTWDNDTVVPQTCPTCHNPHDTGTFSGDVTDAKVRVNAGEPGACGDNTCDTYQLLASFKAVNVGKGATCMTCHNSRADAPRTDANWTNLSPTQKESSPHHGVQADLIMGQNAFFMTSGELVRGKHSLIPNVCIRCHMELTEAPPATSYQNGGTNHTFAADPNICVQCHGNGVTADNIASIVNTYLDELQASLSDAWMRLMTANYPVTIGSCATADVSTKGKNAVNNPITDVQWVYSRGTRLNITVGSVTCNNVAVNTVIVGRVSNNPKNNTTLETLSLQSGNDVLWKAQWNYGLLFEDSARGTGDRGVHNPDFSIKALTRAIDAVDALNP